MKPSKHKMIVLSQIFKLIPRNLIPKLANEFGIDRQSRVFSPTSHVLALVFGQLTHALGLNDICDTLRNHCGLVSKIRDCVPPSRNGLSHANRNRDAGMAEKLVWEVLAHLNEVSPNFRIQGRRYCGLPRRFKRMIHVFHLYLMILKAYRQHWCKSAQKKFYWMIQNALEKKLKKLESKYTLNFTQACGIISRCSMHGSLKQNRHWRILRISPIHLTVTRPLKFYAKMVSYG